MGCRRDFSALAIIRAWRIRRGTATIFLLNRVVLIANIKSHAVCYPNYEVRLVSRLQNDLTAKFLELQSVAESVKASIAVLDGEIFALDQKGLLALNRSVRVTPLAIA